MNKTELRQIIREELQKIRKDRIDEALTKQDYLEIKDIIRAEIAAIMFDLFKKRQMWI